MNRTVRILVIVLALAAAPAAQAREAAPQANADEVVKALLAGNERYATDHATHEGSGAARRKALVAGQHPKAAVLGCADSRVPPEIVLDQGLGELFVVRVAGNVADPASIGSLEYAAEHLGTPVILVLGHTSCGAVKAAVQGGKPEGSIGAIVAELAPAVSAAKATPAGTRDLVDATVHENARRMARSLTERSAILKHLVESGRLEILAGVYDLETGKIALEPATRSSS